MSLPPLEGSRDTGKGIIVSIYPDVCYAKKDPVPFSIYAIQGEDANTAASVRMTGQRAHNIASLTICCHGDEPGVAGVKSGTILSICEPKTHSATVRIEGKHAIRHKDELWMNSRNTVGKLNWVESTESFEPTPPLKAVPKNTADGDSASAVPPAPSAAMPAPRTMLDFPDEGQFWEPGTQLARDTTGLTRAPPEIAPELVPQNAIAPGGVGGQVTPPVNNQPASPQTQPDPWWPRLTLPRVGGPGGPGAMEAMARGDRWLMDNVNWPNDWWEHGFWKERPVSTYDPTKPVSDIPRPEVPSPEAIVDSAPEPHARTEDNVSVRRQCRVELICFKRAESSDPNVPNKFDQQLRMQQDALNLKTPQQVLNSVPSPRGAEALRPLARKAQKAARDAFIENNRIAFIQSHGADAWGSYIKNINAVHTLDIVAGGDPQAIFGVGDTTANQSIGSQWKADSRRGKLLRYAQEMKDNGCPMAVKLAEC